MGKGRGGAGVLRLPLSGICYIVARAMKLEPKLP